MINWLLGLLPSWVRYAAYAVGLICYLVALIKPGSALSNVCSAIATLTGISALFSSAKSSAEAGKKLQATLAASLPMQMGETIKPVQQEVSVGNGVSDQKTDGHSQEAADNYTSGIFNP